MNSDKVALVTGSNRGIGLECVKQLGQKGYQTILTSRKKEDGERSLTSLSSDSSTVHYQSLDVSDDSSVAKLKKDISERFGRLDILINNAGINYDSWQSALEADLDYVRQTLETNLFGAWRMAKAFVPMMKNQKYGRIVNVSSGAGAITGMGGGTPAYSISKASMNVLTIKLAAELKGSGVLINSVCPGWVRTEMGGPDAPRSVEKGAETIVWAAELPGDGPSGKFFRDMKEIDF